jgi:hypothetical protein
VDPDVLLVDEVLAVGDEAFTHKCLDKFGEFRRRGRTVLLVTHSLDLVTRFCDEALWLDGGGARAQGDPKRVVDAYLLDVAGTEDRQLAAADATAADGAEADLREVPEGPPDMFRAVEGRWGSREVEILGVDLSTGNDQATHVFHSGDPIEIRLRVRAREPVTDFVFGVGIFSADGVCCYGTNTQIEGARPGELRGDAEVRFVVDRLELVDGTYKLDVAVHRASGAPYDYHRLLHTFRVKSSLKEAGIFRPPHRWTFSGGVRIDGLP